MEENVVKNVWSGFRWDFNGKLFHHKSLRVLKFLIQNLRRVKFSFKCLFFKLFFVRNVPSKIAQKSKFVFFWGEFCQNVIYGCTFSFKVWFFEKKIKTKTATLWQFLFKIWHLWKYIFLKNWRTVKISFKVWHVVNLLF